MIVLDTHIWVWWANDSEQLRPDHRTVIAQQGSQGLGVSAISCWEVAKLAEKGRLKLAKPLGEWIDAALNLPGVLLLPLTPQIAVESVQLPGGLHGDPADQLIVATARILDAHLITADRRLLDFPGVRTI